MKKFYKMPFKKGDKVKIITGFDKNKISKIINISKKTGKIIVKNINFKIKFKKNNTLTKIEAPIHHSNVKLFK